MYKKDIDEEGVAKREYYKLKELIVEGLNTGYY